MENAKKMIIVSPQDVLQRLQSTQLPSSSPTSSSSTSSVSKVPSDTVSELDREMSRLLNNKNLGDQDKWEQYQQVLQRYLHFASQRRKPIHLPVVDMEVDDDGDGGSSSTVNSAVSNEEIVETFTKTYKQTVRNFLKALDGKKELISWDKEGAVYIRKYKIPKSNIIDLLHDVIRARKSIQPPGWEQLMHVLKEINIPNEFVTNPFSQEYLMRIKGGSAGITTPDKSGNISSGSSSSGGDISGKEASTSRKYSNIRTPSRTLKNTTVLGKSDDKYPSRVKLEEEQSTKRGGVGATHRKWEKFTLK